MPESVALCFSGIGSGRAYAVQAFAHKLDSFFRMPLAKRAQTDR